MPKMQPSAPSAQADEAAPDPAKKCMRCGRIPADQVFFREEKAGVSLMICSVCRLFDACQSSWKTQRYSTDDEQEIERRLTEVLQAMV